MGGGGGGGGDVGSGGGGGDVGDVNAEPRGGGDETVRGAAVAPPAATAQHSISILRLSKQAVQ